MANRTTQVFLNPDSATTFAIDTAVPQVGPSPDVTRYVPAKRLHERAREFRGSDTPGMRVQLSAIRGLTRPGLLKTPYRFQVPPDTFQRELQYTHNDYDTLSQGAASRPSSNQLETVTFSTIFVEYDPSWAVWPNTQGIELLYDDADRDEIWNVLNLLEELENLLTSGTPCLLKCGEPNYWSGGDRSQDKSGDKRRQGGWDVNMPATLRDLTIEEKAGEPDSRYVNCSFSEYRRLDLDRRGRGKDKRKHQAPVRGREDDTPCTVEVYIDSSAIDRTNANRKICTQEGRTRLTAAVLLTAPTLPVVDTSTFTTVGVVHCRSYSIRYTSIDSQSLRGCQVIQGPAHPVTLPVGSLVTQHPGKGATLRHLAKRYYGKPDEWKIIRHANHELSHLGITGDQLLGDACEALGAFSIKVNIPRPPKQPTVGKHPGAGRN